MVLHSISRRLFCRDCSSTRTEMFGFTYVGQASSKCKPRMHSHDVLVVGQFGFASLRPMWASSVYTKTIPASLSFVKLFAAVIFPVSMGRWVGPKWMHLVIYSNYFDPLVCLGCGTFMKIGSHRVNFFFSACKQNKQNQTKIQLMEMLAANNCAFSVIEQSADFNK